MYGRRAISDLFAESDSFFRFPYKIIWKKVPTDDPLPSRFAVSVPKRCFKRAVKRNLIKRRTREVFRTNKQALNEAVICGKQIRLMVIYVADYILSTAELELVMKKILQHIARQYAESN